MIYAGDGPRRNFLCRAIRLNGSCKLPNLGERTAHGRCVVVETQHCYEAPDCRMQLQGESLVLTVGEGGIARVKRYPIEDSAAHLKLQYKKKALRIVFSTGELTSVIAHRFH